jgi:hypothetical protein
MLAPGGQLDQAVKAIGRRSDVAVVTLDIGGNDGLTGRCLAGFNRDSCPFKVNYGAILDRLGEALASDPGREMFKVLAYYNPLLGTASPLASTYDAGLLGSDLRIECSGVSDELGLNDLIECLGRDAGASVIDAYGTFKAAGPRFILDGIHPSEPGHAALACLFAHPDRSGSPDPCGELELGASAGQRVLAQRGVLLSVRTRAASSVAVSGTVRIADRTAQLRLGAAQAELAPGERRSLDLPLRAEDTNRVRRALRAHHRLTARVTALATVRTGRTYRERMTIRLGR